MSTAGGGPPRAGQRTRQPPAFRGRRHRQDRTTDVHTTAERPGPWCPQGAGSQGAVSSAPAAPLSAAALRSDGPRPLAVEKRALVSGCPGPRGGRVTLCWPVTRRSVRGGFGEGARAERPRLGPLRPRPTPPPAAASPGPGISFSDVEKRASSRAKQDSKPLDARPAGTQAAAWALEPQPASSRRHSGSPAVSVSSRDPPGAGSLITHRAARLVFNVRGQPSVPGPERSPRGRGPAAPGGGVGWGMGAHTSELSAPPQQKSGGDASV